MGIAGGGRYRKDIAGSIYVVFLCWAPESSDRTHIADKKLDEIGSEHTGVILDHHCWQSSVRFHRSLSSAANVRTQLSHQGYPTVSCLQYLIHPKEVESQGSDLARKAAPSCRSGHRPSCPTCSVLPFPSMCVLLPGCCTQPLAVYSCARLLASIRAHLGFALLWPHVLGQARRIWTQGSSQLLQCSACGTVADPQPRTVGPSLLG